MPGGFVLFFVQSILWLTILYLRIRAEFSEDQDTLLMKFIATHNPTKQGRSGNMLYHRLVENASFPQILYCEISLTRRTGRWKMELVRGTLVAVLAQQICEKFGQV